MKQRFLPAVLMALITLLISCVPIPSTTPVFPSCPGTVVDAEGYAIPNVTITATRAGIVRKAMSNPLGKFILPAAVQIHYGRNLGPSVVTPPPWYWHTGTAPLIITASAPGYQSATQTIPAREDHKTMLRMPDRIAFQLFTEDQRAVAVPE